EDGEGDALAAGLPAGARDLDVAGEARQRRLRARLEVEHEHVGRAGLAADEGEAAAVGGEGGRDRAAALRQAAPPARPGVHEVEVVDQRAVAPADGAGVGDAVARRAPRDGTLDGAL